MKARCRTAALFTLALACALPALGQTIRVRCSDSLAGLGQKWALAYASGHPDIKIQVEGGAVAAAFAALRDQKASLAIVSRMMRYSETEALQTALGQRPAEFKVGVDAVAVYVNAGNSAQVLTYDELAGIFQGKCRNWTQIGGPVAPIALYSPQTNSAVGELFAEEILNGKEYAAGLRTLAGADLLKAIANDRNGIGYGPLISDPRVRALGIKRALSSTPVEPTEETIANRIYPISRYLYVYLNPAAHQGGLKAWVDWMRSDEGQQIVKAAGFFPLPAKLRSGIQFDRASGFCSSAFDLGLSAPFPDAAIYYTTNGASPGPAAGFRYHRPIPIAGTAIVRAAAFGGETVLTEAAARTYLFIPDLLRQTGRGFPDSWGASEGKPVPAHYGMSSSLADSPASRAAIIEGLRSLPSLSIITDPGNLFSPETGLYAHPTERGASWERPVSAELLCPEGSAGFRIKCGLRIHGGTSRRPEESPKHSFRLVFRARYGPAKLHFPFFGPEGPSEFDSLVLRAGNNDSWLHSDGESRRRACYLRDEWMRASLRAMGYPCARGCFVQLYLNGLYWGLYNLCQQPGAALLPPLQSGPLPEFDARKAAKVQAGDSAAWDRMMDLANAGLDDRGRYEALGQCLDLPEFTDYFILNLYAGNSDWDRWANWYAARPRAPGGKFRFSVWDAECSLGQLEACTLDQDDDQSPLRLFQKLSENAQFRLLFASRARRLLFNDGPLAAGPAARRFGELAKGVERAIAAEAARWGSYRQAVHRYKTGPYEIYAVKGHWEPEIQRLLAEYFPRRLGVLLDQFRQRGLFPQADAPTAQMNGNTRSTELLDR
ncbi:MAG: substrate-binding domain-containing protein [Limisphaerales bacterium]